MVNIVFVGNANNSRIDVLKKIPESKLHIIKSTIKLPSVVIDLFIIERDSNVEDCMNCDMCFLLKNNSRLKHIPLITLINSDYIFRTKDNGCDLMVSDFVSDIEFERYVSTMLKMKLMDDELKKEKIILELKVKERTLELQNKADKLNITLNSIGDGVIVTDINGNVISINPAVEYLCDITDENYYLNKPLKDVFRFFINDIEIDIFNIVNTTKEKFKLPIDSILKTENKNLRISDSASPIFDKDNNFNGMVLVFHDVTVDFEMRKNIIESEKKYKRIYDNVPDIIYTQDLNGNITSINKNVIRMGYTQDEVIGKNIELFLDKKSIDIIKEKINLKLKNLDLITIYNIEIKTKTNEKRIYEIKSSIIRNIDDNGYELFAIARDITTIFEFQEELRIAKDIAENSDKMKTNFISNMTHEIKTPLNSILGFSSLILEQKITEKIKSYTNMINISGSQLSNILDNIIDISDITSGSLKINKANFSLKTLLNEINAYAVDELNKRNKNNIELIKNDDDFIFYGDCRRIKQIIQEVVLNSIKYSNSGYIKYGFIIEDNFVKFYVHDTGIGIEEDKINSVYDSFYQINRQKLKIQEGTGLGLTMCKYLTELFNGDIVVESIYSIGTSVYVNIPIVEEVIKPLIIKTPKLDSYENKDVLIVVEDKKTYEIIQLILLSQKFNIYKSTNYNDVLCKLNNSKFDLIIIDIDNLLFNGYDLINWITKNEIKTPYIISSNKSELSNNVINNPINASQLLNKIKNVFE